MKKLLEGISKGIKTLAVGTLIAVPTTLSVGHTVITTSARSLNNPVIEEFTWMEEVDRLDAEVSSLWTEVGFNKTNIDANSTAIGNNAIAFGGLTDRVDTIETEMLNVDRYETICENFIGPFIFTFKYHYDSVLDIEYWKIDYAGNKSTDFIFGDYNKLKEHLDNERFECDWW